MKRLPKVRLGLARLRLFRSTVRLGVMGSTVLSILLWTLGVAFVLDYWIGMDALERSIVLAAVVAVAAWTVWRYLLPAMKVHESDAALAVLVDARRGLHSNLVAAIEFDDDRPQYGSEQLRETVVENTARAAAGMNFLEGFSRRELVNRLLVFVVTAAICLVLGALYSAHAGAFLSRFVLGDARYPTRTEITEIIISSDGRIDGSIAEGSSVTFEVHSRGREVEAGQVTIEPVAGGTQTTVTLVPRDKAQGVYVGTFPRVLEDLSCTVHLGDAYPERRRLTVVPLPRVKLTMEVDIPDYAAGKVPPRPENRRQVIIPEGSRVTPVITADKEMRSGTLTFEGDETRYELTRRGDALVLNDPASPLGRVTEMVRFEVNVRDIHGLTPENPVRGTVHVSADLPPRVALMAYSRRVLPTATPRLEYQAVDDYALDHLVLHVAVMDADGSQIDTSKTTVSLGKARSTYDRGSYRLALGGKGLRKGYQVLVAIEAVDYRGEEGGKAIEGKSRRSEKWIFEVSDQQGVLEGMKLLTEQMDKKLDEVIRAQVEAGK